MVPKESKVSAFTAFERRTPESCSRLITIVVLLVLLVLSA